MLFCEVLGVLLGIGLSLKFIIRLSPATLPLALADPILFRPKICSVLYPMIRGDSGLF